MATLLLQLAAPMQSWGTRSRFDDRDTERFPSKSGVIGLLNTALGRSRAASVAHLAALRMAARADRPGVLATDFQTAKGVAAANDGEGDTVVSRRHYLADACFLVGLEGELSLLQLLQNALTTPAAPLFLGRRAFPLVGPLLVSEPIRSGALEPIMRGHPWLRPRRVLPWERPDHLLVQWECLPGEDGEPRQDVPINFAERLFIRRYVRHEWVDRPGLREDSDGRDTLSQPSGS